MNRWFYRVCEFMNRDEVADRVVMALVVAVFVLDAILFVQWGFLRATL